MSDYLHLPIAAGVSLLASLSVLAVLTPSLHQLLRRLCPDEAAAAFWLSYTRVMLVIAPLLLVLLMDQLGDWQDPVTALRLALMAALAGLLIGLRIIGRRLGQFVRVPDTMGGAE